MSLHPVPFDALVRRVMSEARRVQSDPAAEILELPARKFHRSRPELDLRVWHHGQPAANPLGPAAGPHTQLAQNLVVGWLAGCRIFELKTVQIKDDLVIPRPCIDMATVGYNVEWSQELKLEESALEYVKGAYLIEMLRASGLVDLGADSGEVIYDMSVGYDLAGVQSAPVRQFLASLRDTTALVAQLREQVPLEFAHLRDVPVPKRLSKSLTLSTFHGCPPGEIEAIAAHLMQAEGLDVTIKLNPTLLGKQRLNEILCDQLGYRDIRVPAAAFDKDASWDQAVGIVERLAAVADHAGRDFGVKFTNTLVVENHRDFFPASEKEMYLSGAPLHVLAIQLVDRFRQHFGDRFAVSFSAGIDVKNFADGAALGLVPVTVCSDLLQPGGYARASGYLGELARRMAAVNATTLGDFALRAYGLAEQALAASGLEPSPQVRQQWLQALGQGVDLRAALGDETAYARWVSAVLPLNTAHYAAQVLTDPRYAAAKNSKPPRKLQSHLSTFDCVSCDKCVPVCPNTALFTYATPALAGLSLKENHQIAVFAAACNDCGNCDVFCPEHGGPYATKPRMHGDIQQFYREAPREGVWLAADGRHALGRLGGANAEVVALESGWRISALGSQGAVVDTTLKVVDSLGLAALGTSDAAQAGRELLWIALGVADPERSNYLNTRLDIHA